MRDDPLEALTPPTAPTPTALGEQARQQRALEHIAALRTQLADTPRTPR